jgi:Phage related hypothetical protein (DUF1799)
MLGLTLADFEGEEFKVFPENWPIYLLFTELSTQWIMGPGGPCGLNYQVLFSRMERMAIAGDKWEDVFQGFRVMEREALAVISER